MNTKNKKLRPWFVKDNPSQINDYKQKLRINNAQKLRDIEKKEKIVMYLGNYMIGRILWNRDSFCFLCTEKLENSIFGILEHFNKGKGIEISESKLDEIIKNGISIEEFVYDICKENGLDVVVTDEQQIAIELIEEGYLPVLAFKDAIPESFRDNYKDDEEVVFVKYTVYNSDTDYNEEEASCNSDIDYYEEEIKKISFPNNKLWFVQDDVEPFSDYEKRLEITSAKQLSDFIDEKDEFNPATLVRMYLGEYEIGTIKYYPEDNTFCIEESRNWWSENIAERVCDVCVGNTLGEIPYEKMDYLIGREFSIEEFLPICIWDYYETQIEDNPNRIWELIHNGYMIICKVNDILHSYIKNNQGILETYMHDKRVVLIKNDLKKIWGLGQY